MPGLVEFVGQQEYFLSMFPPPEFFAEHFKEAIRRNFRAAGDKDEHFKDKPLAELGTEIEEAEDEDSMNVMQDKFLERARSGDTLVGEDFFLS